MADPRPVRMCDSCGGVDDHPRHVLATAPGEVPTSPEIASRALKNAKQANNESILAQIMDDATVVKHMDCCAADGCPDGSCTTIVQESGGKKGSALTTYLTKGA